MWRNKWGGIPRIHVLLATWLPHYLAHPSDAEAWKHLDDAYLEYAAEPWHVRLGLCTKGLFSFGQFGQTYSCWPVILTSYNLPPWLYVKKPYMFLSLLIPGPKSSKWNFDMYMQPQIEEFKTIMEWWGSNIWCIYEAELCNEGSYTVDGEWFPCVQYVV